jgi:hypothetical protein
MGRSASPRDPRAARQALARRVRQVRVERFGDDCGRLADELGLPLQTWLNYEGGVVMPATVLLEFMELTGTSPRWLLTGEGDVYLEY